ncbi:hypothetical protein FSP39_023903 [Pinctada imbricata]|uniref:GMEB1/2/Spe-44-like domain-containing protein n=1 Tax=Pinctada imbricata TaxID=66713 RepID=A0AA88Y3T0_PINIB|nr:hypothetical protein FSP39_023903 [Pinctada imbricata]
MDKALDSHADDKDWNPGAVIRVKKYFFMVYRKYIDAGELTFHNHETTCTGRCQARIPFNKYNATSSPSPTSIPQPTELLTTSTENGLMQIQSVKGGEHVVWDGSTYPQEEDIEDVKPDIQQLQLQMLGNVSQAQKQIQSTLATAAIKQVPLVPVAPSTMVSYPENQMETTDEEDRLLWKGIVELGLVDEFFREIKASLDILKNNMVRRMVPLEDTKKISVIVKQLGLMSKLKYKLEAHQTDMERQRLRLDREMEELQRKVREYELKKEMLKRKSDCFNQLIDMAKKEQDFMPESKRLCSNGPSEIVFPSSFPVRNTASDRGAASDSSNDTNSNTSRSTPTESRRKQKTTEKVVPNYSSERDSIELEYVNGHDYVDDIEEEEEDPISTSISSYHE